MKQNKTILCVSLALLAVKSFASPIVIFSEEPTVSSAPYLQQVSVNPQQLVSNISPSELSALSQSQALGTSQEFPIKTENMSPGIVKPYKINMPYLPAKVFLLGCDSLSQQWLGLHKPQLIKMKAIGLLIQVENKDQLQMMQNLAKPLVLIPESGEQVGRRLGLQHYPVLVSNNQVDQ